MIILVRMVAIEPHTAAEILKFIQERCERGADITISQNFITADGRRLWTIRGSGVDASGYLSLTEAFETWMESVNYLDEREMNH